MLSPARAALRGQDLIGPLQTHLNVVNSKMAGASSVWGPEGRSVSPHRKCSVNEQGVGCDSPWGAAGIVSILGSGGKLSIQETCPKSQNLVGTGIFKNNLFQISNLQKSRKNSQRILLVSSLDSSVENVMPHLPYHPLSELYFLNCLKTSYRYDAALS